MSFTYSDDCFSDLHKDVYGFRPRGIIMENWDSMDPAQKQARWDELCEELEVNNKFEKDGLKVKKKTNSNNIKAYSLADIC